MIFCKLFNINMTHQVVVELCQHDDSKIPFLRMTTVIQPNCFTGKYEFPDNSPQSVSNAKGLFDSFDDKDAILFFQSCGTPANEKPI